MPMRWHAGWRPPNAARGTGTGDDRISAKFISFPLASLAPPMRRSVCQRQNLLRFLLRKVFVFFRPARQPARLPSALLVDLRSGAHWGSSWFWVLLSLRRSHRWTQAQIAVTQTRRFALPVIRSSTFPRTFTRRRFLWPGCATARTLPPSPTADATALPVSWPPRPPPAS